MAYNIAFLGWNEEQTECDRNRLCGKELEE